MSAFSHFLILLLLISVSTFSIAAKVDIKSIDTLCAHSSSACLKQANEKLTLTKERTAQWYKLMLWKLDSLFELAKFDALFKLTSVWVEDESISEYFKIRVLIYHTKVLGVFNNTKERDHFRSIVENYLLELKDNFSDPSLIIDLVNLQLYSDIEPRVPYHMLRKLERKFSKRYDPKFKFDLYNNLGHFASRMKDYKESITAREQALIWAKRTESHSNIAEANFNLARSLQLDKNYALASKHFIVSLEFYQSVVHLSHISLAKLYIALMDWYLGDLEQAKIWFNEVILADLPIGRLPVYQSLKKRLSL
jgi:tetratricopeptide (TPR) repeat protein